MKSLLVVALLAFAWHVAPAEWLQALPNPANHGEEMHAVATAADPAFLTAGSEDFHLTPVVEFSGTFLPGSLSCAGKICEDFEAPRLALLTHAVLGLSPPRA